ncbi:MAG: hypothetical protein NTV56_10640 [Alphaproteobacteria bacterium]|nr:hypothetical protein [Alphaproteobacteria bacterium]
MMRHTRSKMRFRQPTFALASAALLAGCVSDMTYIRTDGRNVSADPALEQQFQKDNAVCSGETERARTAAPPITTSGLPGAVATATLTDALDKVEQTCMSQKGYALVYQNVAEVRLAEFATADVEKRKREASERAALPGPQPGVRRRKP